MKEWREVVINAGSEFRFEVEFGNYVELSVVDGFGEIFGSELASGKNYRFGGCKNALYSYQGCRIRIQGECLSEYVSDETPNHVYMNLHLALEKKRIEVETICGNEPRILTMGNGRNTVNRILVNYAVRHGRVPLWIDMDVTNGNLLFPGTLTATTMEKVVDPVDGIDIDVPISYFYGHYSGFSQDSSEGSESDKLYLQLASSLSTQVNLKMEKDPSIRQSGIFINWNSLSDGPLLLRMLEKTIELFKVNTILVVGNEKLQNDLIKKIDVKGINVLKIVKSGGVINRDPIYRRLEMMHKIHKYFYGPNKEYSPFPVTLSFQSLHIRKFGDGPAAPSSALPLGTTPRIDETRIVKVELITPNNTPINSSDTVYVQPYTLINSILAISHADPGDEPAILTRCVVGYVYITDIDTVNERITLLSSSPGGLPKPYLILGNIKFVEN